MAVVAGVIGPIGAGKSTVAASIASRVAAAGLSVAVADLDDMWMALRAPHDGLDATWARARTAHAALVAGWIQAGVDVLVVHGPFVTRAEREPLLDALPDGVRLRWCLLEVTHDIALARVADDPDRGLSRDPGFLAATHRRFAELRGELPECEWVVDTTSSPVEVTAALVGDDLVRDAEAARTRGGDGDRRG